MNTSKWMMTVTLVALLAGAAFLAVRKHGPRTLPSPTIEPESAAQETLAAPPLASSAASAPAAEPSPPIASEPTPAPAPPDAARPIRESKILQEGGEPKEIVRVKPEQILATVNGTPVTLKDLAAIPDAQRGTEQTISASLFDMLLERAIVREVAFQSANAKGIALTREQQSQLEKFGNEMSSTSPEVVDMTMPPERVAFELRDTEGRMLLVNLAAEAGAPGAFVTEDQVKAYYEGHKAEYEELPADPQEAEWAWRRIDREIRNALAPDIADAYQRAYDKVVEDLKAAATIAVTPAGTP